ncbi:ATP-binding cassette domain-containing protein [Rhizobium helianthi]|uniref:Nickel import system ATP-binding protein NikD n=1 Tax=Rhizobium helianthi TaxID=1132695 RepID=A0ABW4M0B6_9HYPH
MIVDLDRLTVRIPLKGGHVVHAATDVSLSLEKGRLHAVVGESGCGKSTIAQAMTGLLPRTANVTGSVRYRGESIFGREHVLHGRHVALIPQSASTFLTPVRTLGSQLRETVEALGGRVKPEELLSRVELDPSALMLYPHQLSGGMAQRAAVAFALAGSPDVIIADEPTAALDPLLTIALLQLLRHLASSGAAVMLITHDIAALIDTEVADDLSVIYASRLVEQGKAAKLLAGGAQHLYTRDLIAALPRNGLKRMPGAPPTLTNLPEDYGYTKRLKQVGGR